MATKGSSPSGSVQLVLPAGLPLLHPETQVFEGMIEGWRNQMLARNLAESTIVAAVRVVRVFKAHHDVWPWLWTPAMSDEWFADLRSVHHIATSTVRSYQVALRGFCRYVTDPAYGWAEDCERRFGTHPIQLINEVNAAAHVADVESEPRKRAFTRPELQALFDWADDQVEQRRMAGRPRRDHVEDRVRVRATTDRDQDAGRRRLRAEPCGVGVRELRGAVRALRQGSARLATQASQRAHGVAMGGAGAGAVVRRGPAPSGR